MRVALVCPYSLSRPGGVQSQVLGQARALLARGVEVTVLAPADGRVEVDGMPAASLVVVGRSMGLPANGSVAPVALSPAAAVRALRTVRRGGADIVHLHEPLAPGPAYACLLGAPQPKVGTFHRSGPSTAYRLLGPLARWLASRLDVRCAVSEAARDTAARALGGVYEIVPNGVELDRFADVQPWPTEGPTVLFVGRHEQRKGLEVLLRAFTTVVESPPSGDAGPGGAQHGATLWVAGDGPETAALRRRYPSGPSLQWLGPIGEEEKRRRMAGAHVLCAPSLRGESFGVVLLEAMAARAAVVASDLPGYAAVAGGHALLVPPGDIGALARALRGVLADAAAGTGRCTPAALEAAAAHAAQWSMGAQAERYLAIYERLARRAG